MKMKAKTKLAIVSLIAAGILIPSYLCARENAINELNSAWERSWLFDETWDGSGYNDTFWDESYAQTTLYIIWDDGGSLLSTFFNFNRVDMNEVDLEAALGRNVRDSDGTPHVFVTHGYYDIPSYTVMDDAYRVLFFDGTAWVMNQIPLDSSVFTESKISILVNEIIAMHGGIALWGDGR